MRKLLALALLFPAALLHAQQQTALQTQLQAIASAHHGQVALFAENLTTHATVGLRPDTPVQTASVIKLTILYEALEQLRASKVHFEDPIPVLKADLVPGSGILTLLDPSTPAAPKSLTFKDALTLMIIMSDNAATNLAIDHLGIDNINARITTLGLANTHLYKKIFTPVPPGTTLPADFKQFGLGKTTPREISLVMQKIVTCDLATPSAPATPADAPLCAAALHMLQLQFYRTSIPHLLDKLPGYTDTSIANKTGSLSAVRNDVAAIATPSGIVLLSVFTWDNADRSWSTQHEAELTIAKLARALIDAWSPAGLAPWPTPGLVH